MSRPSRLSDEAQDLYVQLVSAGVQPEVAASHIGISAATLYRWRNGSTPRKAGERWPTSVPLPDLERGLLAAQFDILIPSMIPAQLTLHGSILT